MGAEKIPRQIVFGIVILIQICLSLISTLGGLSSVLILDPNYENVAVKNFNANFGSGINQFNFTFILNNTGVYDFHNLTMTANLTMTNISDSYNVLYGTYIIPEIKAESKFEDVIGFNNSDFNFPSDFDYGADYNISLLVNIDFLYSLDLIAFHIFLNFTDDDLGTLGGL
ncbi:MAG: hypothetical protein ACTSRZ_13805 [Promethearchaeota archaeon]